MIRLLMAGTAVAVLATAAFAQSSSSTMDASAMSSAPMTTSASDMGTMSSASDMGAMSSTSDMGAMSSASDMGTVSSDMGMSSAPMASSMASDMTASSAAMTNPAFTILSGYTVASTDQMATKIIGAHVYDGTGQDANDLGKINDFVLNQGGSIAAVVVGVGGFLGIGEKQVAVDFHALQWQVGPDNNRRFVLQTTKDELTNAPDFKTLSPADASASAAAGVSVAPMSSSAQ